MRLLSEGKRIFTWNLQPKRLQAQVHTADSHHFLLALWSSQLRWHGCSGNRMLEEHERYYDFAMDALVIVYSSDERNYGFGMDALVIVCLRNTNIIMILACMLWSSYTLQTNGIMVLAWMLW